MRAGGFDGIAEIVPESIVIDLVGHVQAPAVGALLDPVARHVQQELAHVGVGGIELGQALDAPPGLVIARFTGRESIHREAADVEPVAVGRVLLVLQDIGEGEEAAPAVVEDAIQDDVHIVAVCQIKQGVKVAHIAQPGIDLVVVDGVVAVVGGGVEDGVEVESVDTQVEQVIEMLDDALQIAALEAPLRGRRAPGLDVGRVVTRSRRWRSGLGRSGRRRSSVPRLGRSWSPHVKA